MIEFLFLLIAFLVVLLDIYLLQTIFIGFLGVWMFSSSIIYFILSIVEMDLQLRIGVSLLVGLVPAYMYYNNVRTKYSGSVKTDVDFDDKKLFGLGERARVKKRIDTDRYIVEINGLEWTAISEEPLQPGDVVKIDRTEGTIVRVKK
ncbi:MAG: NfeD family protein [Candidatus Micrarchaeota archaeon]|nr:NfeD family protein [Candidatus Micrarchaeota archaeon]MCX8154305.1 NfeD family protein [Candidatus Micrarchaeota archaeon]